MDVTIWTSRHPVCEVRGGGMLGIFQREATMPAGDGSASRLPWISSRGALMVPSGGPYAESRILSDERGELGRVQSEEVVIVGAATAATQADWNV
jgi:hypothetical protein